MATCAKCGKDVKAFGVIDPTTGRGTCEPCMTGVPVAASPVPAVTASAPAPKVEKKTVVGAVKDAVKGAMTKIKKAVKKDDKTKKRW